MVTEWIRLALGAWIIASPWIFGFASITVMKWSNLAAGLALVLMSTWAIFGEKSQPERPNDNVR